uniref:Uncharacterized protein n=1 Tax=Attheya septentrionalis TaxID=420275 RepID=A0A6T7J5D5_9STRA|mmetsp:Transcript_29296/g.53618  ORF Transcript_29296/g.53618 Transcript_29296/m.53618 type:complete len:110 (+) Transcript_29296:156-485(+)
MEPQESVLTTTTTTTTAPPCTADCWVTAPTAVSSFLSHAFWWMAGATRAEPCCMEGGHNYDSPTGHPSPVQWFPLPQQPSYYPNTNNNNDVMVHPHDESNPPALFVTES